MEEIYFINRLDQIKALSDPLRVSILEALTHAELTTKQVADLLGEPPTKLYRHVETLNNVGLIELIRTNTVNGIVEKYFRAIAKSIRVNQELFTSGPPSEALDSAREAVIRSLESMLQELRASFRSKAEGQREHVATIHQTTITATSDEMKKFNRKLRNLFDEYQNEDPGDDARSYRVTGVVCPLDEVEQEPDLKETES